MRFLVNGSIAFDVLLHYDGSFPDAIDPKHLDRLSVSFIAPGYDRFPGGTGANIAWYLRLLKQDVSLIGSIGKDGGQYLSLLNERGVDTAFVDAYNDAITATAIVATDTGERQIAFFHPGADGFGTLPNTIDASRFGHAIVSPRNPTLMLDSAQAFEHAKIPYFFDPGQVAHAFGRDEFRRAVKGSAGLIVNEYEWAIAQEKLEWSLDDVLAVTELLVITRGDQGVLIQNHTGACVIPAAKPTSFANPTGAGDAFRAGLLAGIGANLSIEDAGRLGAVMGSFAVEYIGTLLPELSMKQVADRFQQTYGKALPTLS